MRLCGQPRSPHCFSSKKEARESVQKLWVGRVTPCAPSSAWGVKRRAEYCARYRNARRPLAAITNRMNSPSFYPGKSAISVVAVKNFRFLRNFGSQFSHTNMKAAPNASP
jgi:hypothetical protein